MSVVCDVIATHLESPQFLAIWIHDHGLTLPGNNVCEVPQVPGLAIQRQRLATLRIYIEKSSSTRGSDRDSIGRLNSDRFFLVVSRLQFDG